MAIGHSQEKYHLILSLKPVLAAINALMVPRVPTPGRMLLGIPGGYVGSRFKQCLDDIRRGGVDGDVQQRSGGTGHHVQCGT